MTTYVISDTHFDDNSVLDEFSRPFQSIKDMNYFVKRRWNSVVDPSDRVIHLGDVVSCPNRDSTTDVQHAISYRFAELNGNISLIKGNHDDIGTGSAAPFPVAIEGKFSYDGLTFECQHRPQTSVEADWGLHGHTHTNHMDTHPFINQSARRVDLSAELLHYTPISLKNLVSLLRSGQDYLYAPTNAL